MSLAAARKRLSGMDFGIGRAAPLEMGESATRFLYGHLKATELIRLLPGAQPNAAAPSEDR